MRAEPWSFKVAMRQRGAGIREENSESKNRMVWIRKSQRIFPPDQEAANRWWDEQTWQAGKHLLQS